MMRMIEASKHWTTGIAAIAFCGAMACAASAHPLTPSACRFEAQGQGRVGAIIDARTFRLEDGREVRLSGIESLPDAARRVYASSLLATLVEGRDVELRGADDAPDRYGRQSVFAFLEGAVMPVQAMLLEQGAAVAAATVADKTCAAELVAAETEARRTKRGVWSDPAAIKNAESPGDILVRIGQFAVVEGKVVSVRQAGAIFYVNFGRRWTRDFAVTISRRAVPSFEAAGIALKSLENRRVRVRGWVEQRGGPRIEAFRVGQIEIIGQN